MTLSKFNLAEIKWADALLAQPAYVMANGRSSHDVAYEVKAAALDRMIEQNTLTADGRWS